MATNPTPTSPGPSPGESPIAQSRIVAAGNGWRWIADAWKLFTKQPGNWILVTVIGVVILVVLMLIPIVGGLAAALITPILLGGLMLGCKSLDGGESLAIGHLFAGFQQKAGKLALVGVFNLVATLVVMLIMLAIVGAGTGMGALMGRAGGGEAGMGMGALAGLSTSMVIGGLIALALAILVAAAVWFAPALISFGDSGPAAALKTSFWACMRNFVPFLVYGVVMLILAIVATIPLALGWLVLGPVLIASIYTAYRDIFGGDGG